MERAHIHYGIGKNYNKKSMLSKSPNPFNNDTPEYNVLTMNYTPPPPPPPIHKTKESKAKKKRPKQTKRNLTPDKWKSI